VAAENIADYFGGPGAVTATAGAESAQVYLDKPDAELFGGRVESTEYLMTYPHTAFTSLAEGDAITVDGTAYTVREAPAQVDDGKIMRAMLTKT
jgi:hypothetical protein